MAADFLRLEMLPARHGDALLLEWGDERRTRRLLVDGGPIGAFADLQARFDALPAGDRRFELIVLSHVDTDHVDGLVRLFAQAPPWPFVVKDVWFNGWRHLEATHGLLGGKQGEFFSALLARRLEPDAWNGAFDGQAVVVRDDGPLPEKTLPGGLKLTLLSPTVAKLDKMREAWRRDVGTAIEPGDLDAAWELLSRQKRYLGGQGLLGSAPALDALLERQAKPDASAANGSSIALLAEFAGKSVLLLGDAHADAVCASLRRLLLARGLDRLAVGAVKLAHHGSKANTDDDLLSLLASPNFLFSSNGAIFRHPDDEAVQRVIRRAVPAGPMLCFNYRSVRTAPWEDAALQQRLGYATRYPAAKGASLVLSL